MKIDLYYNKEKKTTEFKTLEAILFKFKGKIHLVPKGFISDGMSVPKILWPIISPKIDGLTIRQSIINDYMFHKKMGFFASNYWYYNALFALNKIKRIMVLIGLTFFGWYNYYFK